MTDIEEIPPEVYAMDGTGVLFMLKARTDVPAAGINAGDWVVVREQSAAAPGDVTVAMTEGVPVLSAGPPANGASVAGVVVSVLRR